MRKDDHLGSRRLPFGVAWVSLALILISPAWAAPLDEAELRGFFEARWRAAAEAPSPLRGAYGGCNVVSIQIESLQTFPLHRRLEGREITPELNRLAERGLEWTCCFGQTAGGNTSDAELLALCSLLPLQEGAAFRRCAGRDLPSLPRALKAAGYRTAVFHGNEPEVWNRHRIYPRLGMDLYVHAREFGMDERIGLGLSDRSFFEQTLPRLKELRRPFFAHLMTLSSHHPFQVGDATDFHPGPFAGTPFGDYLRSVHYADRCIGDFVRRLEASELGGNTLVVLYGDHRGITLEQRGDLARFYALTGGGGPTGETEDAFWWRQTLTVPLILLAPGREGVPALQGRRDAPVGQVDIAPTLASLLGVPLPWALGQDLLNRPDGLVVFRRPELIDRDYWSAFEGQRVRDRHTGGSVLSVAVRSAWREAMRRQAASDALLERGIPSTGP